MEPDKLVAKISERQRQQAHAAENAKLSAQRATQRATDAEAAWIEAAGRRLASELAALGGPDAVVIRVTTGEVAPGRRRWFGGREPDVAATREVRGWIVTGHTTGDSDDRGEKQTTKGTWLALLHDGTFATVDDLDTTGGQATSHWQSAQGLTAAYPQLRGDLDKLADRHRIQLPAPPARRRHGR